LPEGSRQHDAIDTLAAANSLVLLLSHGNKYKLPEGWILPGNVKLLEYDLDMTSIQAAVVRIRDILREFGVDVHSRHLDDREALPIPLAGAIITMNVGTQLVFLNGENSYTALRQKVETPSKDEDPTKWDIL
jgi:hypothetical protein